MGVSYPRIGWTVLFLLTSLLAPAESAESAPSRDKDALPKEVMFYSDGRHSSVYMYEPPMGIRQYVEPINELLDLGIDTITYAVGDCSVLLYDTQVGERWGHNLDLVNHIVWYRAGQNARSLIERGMDPLRAVCEHAQKRGFQFLPHLLLNMLHTPPNRVTSSRVADFTTRHPEWQVGPEPDYPEAAHDLPNRLSYSVPEVRNDRLAVIRELVTDYPTDGIELNFHDYVPLIGRGEAAEHTSTLTDWMREIRAVCKRAAKLQNRSKRVVVRIAASLEGNLAMGMDLKKWIQEGLVDTVIGMPFTHGFEGGASQLAQVVKATAGTEVKVLAGMGIDKHKSRESYYASAVNAYAAGADGILFHTYYPGPNMYPYTDAAFENLRFIGYPDVLAHKDKLFQITSNPKPDMAPKYGIPWQLPAKLVPGEPGPEIRLEVADDVAAKARAGELWRCELKIMLRHMMHTDKVRLWWNGKEVPAEMQRFADMTYQMRPRPRGSRGYRIHVDLKGDWLPQVGPNTLRVEVLEKDAKLIHPIRITYVELAVDYLPHRNGLRPDEK